MNKLMMEQSVVREFTTDICDMKHEIKSLKRANAFLGGVAGVSVIGLVCCFAELLFYEERVNEELEDIKMNR